jgi:hypothetical protein
MAKTQIALTSAFAKRYGMNLSLTLIPIEYPFKGPLEFHESTSRELFKYASDCAQQGKLWNTLEQSIAHSEKTLSKESTNNLPTKEQAMVSCPLDEAEMPTLVPTESR